MHIFSILFLKEKKTIILSLCLLRDTCLIFCSCIMLFGSILSPLLSLCIVFVPQGPPCFFFLLSFHLELGLYMPLCYWFLFCSEMECKAQIGKFRHNFPVHFTAIDFPVDYYPSLDCLMWVSLGFLPWVFRAMPGYIEVEIYDCSWFLKFTIMWLKDEIMFGNLICNWFLS